MNYHISAEPASCCCCSANCQFSGGRGCESCNCCMFAIGQKFCSDGFAGQTCG